MSVVEFEKRELVDKIEIWEHQLCKPDSEIDEVGLFYLGHDICKYWNEFHVLWLPRPKGDIRIGYEQKDYEEIIWSDVTIQGIDANPTLELKRSLRITSFFKREETQESVMIDLTNNQCLAIAWEWLSGHESRRYNQLSSL